MFQIYKHFHQVKLINTNILEKQRKAIEDRRKKQIKLIKTELKNNS